MHAIHAVAECVDNPDSVEVCLNPKFVSSRPNSELTALVFETET